MGTRPFRWTSQHKLIREALHAGVTKDEIMMQLREGCKGFRDSEAAMTLADWSMAIDRVQERVTT